MGAIVRSARQAAPVVAQHSQTQYLTFQVGSEVVAIAILGIREILEYRGLTTVPMMPSFIRGVINLRGRVVPVVDLAARIGRQPGAVTKRTCIVILEVRGEGQQQDIGLVVDMVNAVLEIPDAEIEPAPSFGARIRADFITGMGKVAGKFVIVLNVDKVLSVEELSSLGQLAGAEEGPSGGDALVRA